MSVIRSTKLNRDQRSTNRPNLNENCENENDIPNYCNLCWLLAVFEEKEKICFLSSELNLIGPYT